MRFFIGVIALLLIAGCAQEKVVPAPVPEPQEVDEVQYEKVEEKPLPKEVPKPLSKEVSDLLNKSRKVYSYSYIYYGPPNDGLGLQTDVYKGNIKVSLANPTKGIDGKYYDTIYLFPSNQTALAYCEEKDSAYCPFKGAQEVDYSLYVRPLALSFTANIKSASLRNEELLENRKVAVLTYTNSKGVNGTMWLDKTYGLPLKVIAGQQKYEFRSMYVNTLSEQDIMHKP